MDDRQQQVKIGAGLEESRINQELIDWLNKWGMRILIVILLVVVAYQGTRLLEARANDARNKVFTKYYELVEFNDPGVVLEFGEEHRDQPGVWEMASMQGALMLLNEGTSGVVLGAFNRFAPTEDEKLSREEREQRYTRAAEVFQMVADETADDKMQRVLHLQALSGRASALLSLGNYDEARTLLERVIELGGPRESEEDPQYGDIIAFAEGRLQYWDDLKAAPQIVSREDLPVRANSNTLPISPSIDFSQPFSAEDLEQAPGPESPEFIEPGEPTDLPDTNPEPLTLPEPAQDPATDPPGSDG